MDRSDVFVGNLHFNTTEAMLRDHFSSVGTVTGVKIMQDRDTQRPKGFAFVTFKDAATAVSIDIFLYTNPHTSSFVARNNLLY